MTRNLKKQNKTYVVMKHENHLLHLNCNLACVVTIQFHSHENHMQKIR